MVTNQAAMSLPCHVNESIRRRARRNVSRRQVLGERAVARPGRGRSGRPSRRRRRRAARRPPGRRPGPARRARRCGPARRASRSGAAPGCAGSPRPASAGRDERQARSCRPSARAAQMASSVGPPSWAGPAGAVAGEATPRTAPAGAAGRQASAAPAPGIVPGAVTGGRRAPRCPVRAHRATVCLTAPSGGTPQRRLCRCTRRSGERQRAYSGCHASEPPRRGSRDAHGTSHRPARAPRLPPVRRGPRRRRARGGELAWPGRSSPSTTTRSCCGAMPSRSP